MRVYGMQEEEMPLFLQRLSYLVGNRGLRGCIWYTELNVLISVGEARKTMLTVMYVPMHIHVLYYFRITTYRYLCPYSCAHMLTTRFPR